MINRVKLLMMAVLVVMIVLFLPDGHGQRKIVAQSNDESCRNLLTEALQVVGSTCAEVGHNEACYGHFPITSELSSDATGQFESDGDMIDLIELHSVVTQPADPDTGGWGVALMLVQADLPEEIDAAMTFVLFGDGELNSLGEATIPAPTCPISNNTGNTLNIRSEPSTNGEIVESLAVGESTTATGRDESGMWLQVNHNGTLGWVFQTLVTSNCNLMEMDVAEDNATPPLSTTSAFTLRTGQSESCQSLPDGLLVHSPEGQRARVVVNGVELRFSSVGFLTARADEEMTVQGISGQIGVTVGGDTEIVMPNFISSVPLSGLTPDGPPSTPVVVLEGEDDLMFTLDSIDTMLVENGLISLICRASSASTVNLRGSPSSTSELTGTIEEGQEVVVVGSATGGDGYLWWRLSNGSWVRSDLVALKGECDDVPLPIVPPSNGPSGPTGASAAPIQLSPADGSVFSHFPRTTTLNWSAVSGAVSYVVEVDCFHCCVEGQWCTDVGRMWQIVPDVAATSFTFEFVGAQPGRWRVWAVFADGSVGPKSGWWIFTYTV